MDVYGEACFSEKKIINGLSMSLPVRVRVKKTIHQLETHGHFSKGKVLGVVVNKKVREW